MTPEILATCIGVAAVLLFVAQWATANVKPKTIQEVKREILSNTVVRCPYPLGSLGVTIRWFSWNDDDEVWQTMPPGAPVKVISFDERRGCCIVVLEFLANGQSVRWNIAEEPEHVKML